MIRLALPDIDERDIAAVVDTLRSGYLVQGERVRELEELIARHVGVRHAVVVSNCTAALHLALLAAGVAPGDKVAVTTYSWPATANVIVLCGADPVFVDIDPRTFNIDPDALERALGAHPDIRVVLPVHAFGGMADMPRIMEIAARHGATVIEDAACALGARLDGRAAGAWGRIGCFSFHPRKAVTTGEGGAVVTDDRAIADRVRALRNHGQDPNADAPDFVLAGYNLRMTEFQAALGITQMAKLDALVARRRERAERYHRLLADSPVAPPISPEGTAHVYQSYVVLLPLDSPSSRDEAIAGLRARGIEATIGTHHMPLTTYLRRRGGHQRGDFPNTESVHDRAVSLPMHSRLEPREQEQVVEALLSLVTPAHRG